MKLIKCISSCALLALLFAPLAYCQESEAAQFLAALIKIDTSNPPCNETRSAEYLKGVLESAGKLVAQRRGKEPPSGPAEVAAPEPMRIRTLRGTQEGSVIVHLPAPHGR